MDAKSSDSSIVDHSTPDLASQNLFFQPAAIAGTFSECLATRSRQPYFHSFESQGDRAGRIEDSGMSDYSEEFVNTRPRN
jgi:hypothetical protein